MGELFNHLLTGQVTEREWIALAVATAIGLLAWGIGRRRGDTWSVFSIEVTDRNGTPRQGWLSFRARWFRPPIAEVTWR
jgi:hypothetical protein